MENSKDPDIEKPEIGIPDEFKGLFIDPPLLEGEDPESYRSLLGAIIKDRKPEGFDEWVFVHDHVTLLWEEQRFRRASTGLMRGEMFNALKYFLGQISAEGGLKKLGEPTQMAFAYFSESPKEREKVISLLARYGISPAALQAKAAQLNSDAVQMFEAMSARRQKGRRRLRKDEQRLDRNRDARKNPEAGRRI